MASLEYHKQWRAKNREKVRQACRRWQETHREYFKQYRINHQKEIAEYRDSIREKQKAYFKIHYKLNRSRYRANGEKRRALLRNKPSEFIDIGQLRKDFRGRCAICGKNVSVGKESIDHIIPIARDGANIYSNVQLTHFACNRQRGAGRIPAQIRLQLV